MRKRNWKKSAIVFALLAALVTTEMPVYALEGIPAVAEAAVAETENAETQESGAADALEQTADEVNDAAATETDDSGQAAVTPEADTADEVNDAATAAESPEQAEGTDDASQPEEIAPETEAADSEEPSEGLTAGKLPENGSEDPADEIGEAEITYEAVTADGAEPAEEELSVELGTALATGDEPSKIYAPDNVTGDNSISQSAIVMNDITYQANLLVNADFDLNGKTVTVYGNLSHKSGTITFNGGTLIIKGDYVNREGESYQSWWHGILAMDQAKDHMIVESDFYMNTFSTSKPTAGTIEVAGNFWARASLQPTEDGTHKVILNGDKDQTVTILSTGMWFNELEIVDSESRKVTFDTNIRVNKVANDFTIQTGGTELLNIVGMDLNGKTVTINGDVMMNEVYRDLDLNGGKLTINGDFTHNWSRIVCNHGELVLNGNYKAYKDKADHSSSGSSNGSLVMENDDDRITISGDFEYYIWAGPDVIAGTLTLGGNVWIGYYDSLNAKGTHKVVLAGTGERTVCVECRETRFNQFEVESGITGITWSGYMGINALACDVSVTSGNDFTENFTISKLGLNTHDMTINGDAGKYGDFDLDGGTLTITGDFTDEYGTSDINGGTLHVEKDLRQLDSTIKTNGGALVVDGDYKVQREGSTDYARGRLQMETDSDTVTVGGSLVLQAQTWWGEGDLKAGTINVAGDFIQLKSANNSTYCFRPGYAYSTPYSTNKVVLNGTGKQTIKSELSGIWFNQLEIKNSATRDVTCEGYFGVRTLVGDTRIKAGTGFTMLNVTLTDTGNLTVVGDAVIDGRVVINGGTHKITDNLRHISGQLTISGGNLTIGGDYRIQKEDGAETESSGRIEMSDKSAEDSEVRVGGNFVVQATNYSYLTYGKLYVGGNFEVLNVSRYGYISYGGISGATHTVYLNGTGPQTVVSEQEDARLNRLEIVGSQDRSVTWKGYMGVKKLVGDMKLTVGAVTDGPAFTITQLGLDADTPVTLDITGDVVKDTYDNIELNGGKLNITGNLRHLKGTVKVKGGTLTVSGDYLNQKADDATEESTGILEMSVEGDAVTVGGDFVVQSTGSSSLSKGTLTVGGDFMQLKAGNSTAYLYYASSGSTHKIILNGAYTQKVRIESENTQFNQIQVKSGADGEPRGISWEGHMDVKTFSGDTVVTVSGLTEDDGFTVKQLALDSGEKNKLTIAGSVIQGGNVNLNGGTLHITQNLLQASGEMNINSGELIVDGWYKLQKADETASSGRITMKNEADHVVIAGDFVINNGGNTNTFTNGILEVGGNISQIGTGSSSFKAAKPHKTILNGAAKQTVTSEAEAFKFGVLQLTKPNLLKNYEFTKDSCWDELIAPSVEGPNYNVTFEMNGHGSAIEKISVPQGDIIPKQETPVAEGYDFGGWYADEKLTIAWDFEANTVTKDMTLYAKWTEKAGGGDPADPDKPKECTVTFNTDGGLAVDSQTVKEGEKVTKPAKDPTKEGYTFNGWYKDKGLTVKWNFDTETVNENTTIYAGWTQNTSNPGDSGDNTDPKTYTVIFHSNGGSAVASQTIKEGEKVTKPTDPTKEGYTFGGWYKDDALSTAWNFDADTVTAATTLYAKWTQNAANPDDPTNPEDPTNPDNPTNPDDPTEPEEPDDPTGTYYGVHFVMNGHGTQVPDQNVMEGRKVKKPDDPVAEGYTFKGWYRNVACTKVWDFATDTVDADTRLYAGWDRNYADDTSDSGDDYYGEYQGDRKDLEELGAKIGSIKKKAYNGLPYTPAVKVTCKDGKKTVTLTEGTDYTVSYTDNVNAGTGTVTVTGCGTYTGELTKDFTISPKSMKSLKVIVGGMTVGDDTDDLPIHVYDGDELLVEEEDYTLSPKAITGSKGKKNVAIKGTGNYTGKRTVKVTVYAASKVLKAGDFELAEDTYTYTGKALKPKPEVVNESIKSKNYKIKYSNNKNAGVGCITITGKSGYTGSVVLNFRILPLEGEFVVNGGKDIKAVTYNGKIQKPKVSVKAKVTIGDKDKTMTLKAGRDYTVTYKNNLHASGEDSAYVVITGKGNYASVTKEVVPFTIKAQKLSKAKISGTEDNYTVKYGKQTLLPDIDFELVEAEPAGSGKVKLKLEGKGDFEGELTKTVKASSDSESEEDEDE